MITLLKVFANVGAIERTLWFFVAPVAMLLMIVTIPGPVLLRTLLGCLMAVGLAFGLQMRLLTLLKRGTALRGLPESLGGRLRPTITDPGQ